MIFILIIVLQIYPSLKMPLLLSYELYNSGKLRKNHPLTCSLSSLELKIIEANQQKIIIYFLWCSASIIWIFCPYICQLGYKRNNCKNIIVEKFCDFLFSFQLNLIFSVHRQTSYRDKPPNATNVLRDKRTKDKRTNGISLK